MVEFAPGLTQTAAMAKPGYVYIMTNRRNGTLYVGVTGDLVRRTWQHRTHAADGFTTRYGLDQLVYFEAFDDIEQAIVREKHIKAWKRRWKLELIEGSNPAWRDLWADIAPG